MGISDDAGANKAIAQERLPDRVAYLLTSDATGTQDVSVRELLEILRSGIWIGVAITTLFAVVALAYAMTAEKWYRAEVLVAPAKERSGAASLGGLAGVGGLAAIAGISVGGTGNAESLAVLHSREFLGAFIEDLGIMPMLLPVDEPAGGGFLSSADSEVRPDMRDAIKYFRRSLLSTSQDDAGLVTLAVNWRDPAIAAEWANALVARLNERMRQQALREAEANLSYLREQMAQTTLVPLQQSIGRLLESEMQNVMLAQGNSQFTFRVLDPAEAPKDRVWPARTLIVLLAVLLGMLVSVLAIFIAHGLRAPGRLDD